MTVGTIARAPARSQPGTSARDVARWTVGVLCARYVATGLRDLWRGTDASFHLANFGVFQLAAWAAIFLLLARADATTRASKRDCTVAALASAAVLLPDDNAAWVGLSVLAFYVLLAFPNDRHLRAAGAVMAALVTQLFWGRLLFDAVAFPIEVLDARLAAGLLSILHQSVALQGNVLTTAHHQIAIYAACTSFHNISVAMLCWVTVTKLVRPQWRRRDLWTAGTLIAVTVAMNSMRLFLMASSATNSFATWHTGTGAEAINAGLSLLVVAISFAGATLRGGRT